MLITQTKQIILINNFNFNEKWLICLNKFNENNHIITLKKLDQNENKKTWKTNLIFWLNYSFSPCFCQEVSYWSFSFFLSQFNSVSFFK